MFTSIVVALDLEWEGDRALTVADALSKLGDVSVELLTVQSPLMSEDVDAFQLRQRATANGWPSDSYVIVHSHDVSEAIVDHVSSRPGALLVMSTTAKSPLKNYFLGSVSEAVLNRIHGPVLLIGPHVPADTPMNSTTLIACVDSTDVAASAFPVITSWVHTFASSTPWVIEVQPASHALGGGVAQIVESSHVRHLAKDLAAIGVETSWEVMHGDDIVERVEEFSSNFDDAVLVATSANWTDDHTHWHSTTRRLVQHTTRPVLVVPTQSQHRPT